MTVFGSLLSSRTNWTRSSYRAASQRPTHRHDRNINDNDNNNNNNGTSNNDNEGSTTRSDGTGHHEQCRTGARAGRDQQRRRLLTVSQLPLWMRDNDFLRGSYRPQQPTIWSCVKTGLFQLTNDSMNIYTHLVGFLAMLPLTYYLLVHATSLSTFSSLLSKLPPCTPKALASTASFLFNSTSATVTRADGGGGDGDGDKALSDALRLYGLSGLSCLLQEGNAINNNNSTTTTIATATTTTIAATKTQLLRVLREHKYAMTPLLVAGIVCLLFSTVFHMFWVLSPAAMKRLAKLDFSGIACLCLGHGMTGLYYTYYCSPTLAQPFFIMMTIAFLIIIPLIMTPRFATPQWRTVRGCAFGGLGALSLFPVMKALFYMRGTADVVAVASALIAMAMYGIGGFIYVSRFPECCRIGKHDRFFASHQLMHMFVLGGIATHLSGCYYLLHLRVQYGCSM